MMLFFRFVVELLKVQMPPPLIEPLPEKVLLVTFRIAALLMPPPVPLLAELLPEKVLLVTFTVPAFWPKGPLKMPPPEQSGTSREIAGWRKRTDPFV